MNNKATRYFVREGNESSELCPVTIIVKYRADQEDWARHWLSKGCREVSQAEYRQLRRGIERTRDKWLAAHR